jgi:hypothetical protein
VLQHKTTVEDSVKNDSVKKSNTKVPCSYLLQFGKCNKALDVSLRARRERHARQQAPAVCGAGWQIDAGVGQGERKGLRWQQEAQVQAQWPVDLQVKVRSTGKKQSEVNLGDATLAFMI